jgi:tRNA (cytidine/uridine-2'-O-)-methyltransferase
VMFHEPCIPPNTGNGIRMAAVTGTTLHLVEPLGFDLSEPKLKRAGLDYHDLASVVVHPDLDSALDSEALASSRVFALLFGPEPTGLSDEVMSHARVTDRLRIPMMDGRRSLNLANCAAVVTYEAWRQHGFAGAR